MEYDSLDYAMRLAYEYHSEQKDKAGIDYIYHVTAVAMKCENKNEKIVALLHDILEDTNMTISELIRYFSREITEAVEAITRKKNESYADYLSRVKINKIAKVVKIQDIKHNLCEWRLNEKPDSKFNFKSIKDRYELALDFLLGNHD